MSSPLVCLYYMRGSCRYGNRCRRSHDQGSVRTERPYNMDEEFYRMTVSPSSSASRPRQRNQVLPNSAKRSSETNETASSVSKDEWRLKNNDTGKKIAGKQLPVKNDRDNFSWIEQLKECLESDLQCNICYEMFIKPTVLNCSHTFCHECIESWTQSVNCCPTCRAHVINKSYSLNVDSFLDKIVEFLPDEIKTRRETLKVERNNNREIKRNQSNNARTRNDITQTLRPHSDNYQPRISYGRYGTEWHVARMQEAMTNFEITANFL